jgi:hypothetical protein
MMIAEQSAAVNFQGKHAGEIFQFCFRQHWIRLLWPFIKLVLWNMLIIGFGMATLWSADGTDQGTRQFILILLTTFFLLVHFEFLMCFYRYFLYVVIVTDKKIHRIKKTLFIINDHQSIDLWMLQDIFKSQHGIIQNIFGYGSLVLEAQDTLLRVHFTPRITEKYEKLMALREQARSRMMYSEVGRATLPVKSVESKDE